MDFTEIHSFMTRSEAVLQNPEFSVSRKEGSVADLYEKVLVGNINMFCSDSPFSYNKLISTKLINVCWKAHIRLQSVLYYIRIVLNLIVICMLSIFSWKW